MLLVVLENTFNVAGLESLGIQWPMPSVHLAQAVPEAYVIAEAWQEERVHSDVAECAVTGVADALKGQVPLGFVVVNAGVSREPGTLEAELVALVRDKIGPVAAFKQVCLVTRLPKTRSGKVLRGTMRRIADSQPWRTPPTPGTASSSATSPGRPTRSRSDRAR